MSLITILMFLTIAACVCLVVHVLQRDKLPLWVVVALLCLIELLRTRDLCCPCGLAQVVARNRADTN